MCPVLPFTHFVQIVSVIVQVSAGAYLFAGFVDWLPLLVVVILGWLHINVVGRSHSVWTQSTLFLQFLNESG